jgi:hypothetical protein
MENKSGRNEKKEEHYRPEPGKISRNHRDASDQLTKDRPDEEEIGIRRNAVAGHVLCRPAELIDLADPRPEKNQDQKNSSDQNTEAL